MHAYMCSLSRQEWLAGHCACAAASALTSMLSNMLISPSCMRKCAYCPARNSLLGTCCLPDCTQPSYVKSLMMHAHQASMPWCMGASACTAIPHLLHMKSQPYADVTYQVSNSGPMCMTCARMGLVQADLQHACNCTMKASCMLTCAPRLTTDGCWVLTAILAEPNSALWRCSVGPDGHACQASLLVCAPAPVQLHRILSYIKIQRCADVTPRLVSVCGSA